MVQNILVEFTADTKGLAPAQEGLEQLLGLDKNISASFGKTNDTLKQRQQIIAGNETALQKFVQTLLASQRAAIGDTYSKTLEGIREQLQLTDQEAVKFYGDIIRLSQQQIIGNDDLETVATLTKLIDDAQVALSQLNEVGNTPIDLKVNVDDAQLKNTETEIENIGAKTVITPKIQVSDTQIAKAIADIQTQLTSKNISFEALSAASQQAKDLLPSLQQDSQAYKDLGAQISLADQQLDKFILDQGNVNRIIEQLKSALSGGLGNLDLGSIDFTNLTAAKQQIDALGVDAAKLKNILTEATIAIKQLNPGTTQFAQLDELISSGTVSLEQYNTALKEVGGTQDNTSTKTVRATQLLRDMRQELLVMEETGVNFSKKFGLSFDELSIKAAKLQDDIGDTNQRIQQLSSETFPLDAIVGSLTGIAAGFNAASGAAILFGGDQKDVMESILKVQAAMQLLTGLQTIYNLLVDQSVVKTGLQVAAQKIFGTQVKATAVAMQEEVVATEEATVAQEGLNVAMEANPIGILLAGVVLLVAAFATYKLTIGSVTDEEKTRTKTLEAMADAEAKAADSFASEEANLNILLATAKDKNLTDQERERALTSINEKYPEYLNSLKLDNLYTDQSAGLIENQVRLLKERAFVQAAQDLYTEKLKKVAEAEVELNRIQTVGATYWEKLKGNLANIGSALTGASSETNALSKATKDLTDAQKESDIALNVVKKGIDDVSNSMRGGVDSFSNYIHQFDVFKASVTDFKLPDFNAPQIKPFDPAAFDEDKKAALELAQYRLDVAKKGSKEEFDARRALAELEKKLNADDVRILNNDKLAGESKYLKDVRQIDRDAMEQSLKDSIAASQAIVLQETAAGREASTAFFNARRDVLIKSAQEAKNQEGITAGEILKINAQLHLDLQNLEKEHQLALLQIQKTNIQDRINLAKKGSQEEFDAQIALMEIEKQIEITNAQGNKNKIAEINDRFRRDELEKTRQFALDVAATQASIEISHTNDAILQLQIQGQKDTDDSILELKKKLIDEQAALEVISIQKSVANEELRAAKIKEVYDKALEDKKELERQKNQIEIDAALQAQQKLLDIQKSGLDNLNSSISSFGPARIALSNAILQNDLKNIEIEKRALEQEYADGIISATEYNKGIIDLDFKAVEAQIANIDRLSNARIAGVNFFADTFSKIINVAFENEKANLQASAEENQNLADKKIITQQEFNKRQAQLKKEEANINRLAAISSIFIDTAKQLFSITAKAAEVKATAAVLAANPLTAAYAPIALAQIPIILSQIPQILAQQGIALALVALGKFKQGKVKIQGPGTETSDSIPARISKNESVISAKATTSTTEIKRNKKTVHIKNEEALSAINEMRFDEYLKRIIPELELPEFINDYFIPVYHFIKMADMPQWTDRIIQQRIINNRESDANDFDYDLLSEKVGKSVADHQGKIEDMPGFSMDENGFIAYTQNRMQRTEFLNKKFSSKG